jgi:alpha-L-arabinofuranosidase
MKHLLSSSFLFFAIVASVYAQNSQSNRIILAADNPGPVISKDIYGQFSEHLGACIYGGLWVGKDSPIPNTNGIRTDVLNALKEIKYQTYAGPAVALPIHITGGMA